MYGIVVVSSKILTIGNWMFSDLYHVLLNNSAWHNVAQFLIKNLILLFLTPWKLVLITKGNLQDLFPFLDSPSHQIFPAIKLYSVWFLKIGLVNFSIAFGVRKSSVSKKVK